MIQLPPEKLGSFYLGAEHDIDSGETSDIAVNYDARDLTTHAVCVGMTGSGKTGLCLGLLEEAAMDRVPAILIDPKGDITNLLLQFPNLAPSDFEPWINADDARRKGKSVQEYAADTASMWRDGLHKWGISPDRIRMLNETTDYTIFTPGSDAGVPINILGSLAAPRVDFDANAEAIRERISGTVAALLGLVGIKADPLRSREAVLLSNVFEHFWRQNKDLDLAQLILAVQTPPVRQIGVFDVDTFFPAKDRFDLAMAFNNLMAAPSFQGWLTGEPLDIDSLYFTADGRPRHSIFYIAHLSDNERMFFITLLLENVLMWMRRQSGTTSLRALLYFDEVFGFFPPTAEPPSKRPLLTLLKQARAFGLGTILVTQNPVDIDYKGLTNAGTWFIGKLQAERDKARVLEGLKGAIAEAGGNSDIDYDRLISQLGSRVFLLHNVHSDRPIVFHTRWAMSYLRGPLTKPQIGQLMDSRRAAAAQPTPQRATIADMPSGPPPPAMGAGQDGRSNVNGPVGSAQFGAAQFGGARASFAAAPGHAPAVPARQAAARPNTPPGMSTMPPQLDPKIKQIYLPIEVNERVAIRQLVQEEGNTVDPQTPQLVYEAALVGAAGVRFFDRKRDIDQRRDHMLLVPAPTGMGGVDWADAERLPIALRDLLRSAERVDPQQGPFFATVPEKANNDRELRSIAKDFADWLYYNSELKITTHPGLGVFQHPDENERAFKARLQQAAREARDAEVDKLQQKVEKQIERIEKKLSKEKRELSADEADYDSRKRSEWLGIGESVLGAVLGRRSTRAFSAAANKRRMTVNAREDIEESKEVIEELKEEIDELNEGLDEATEEVTMKWAKLLDNLETDEIKPRRTDVDVDLVALAWLPFWRIPYMAGTRQRAATIAAYATPREY